MSLKLALVLILPLLAVFALACGSGSSGNTSADKTFEAALSEAEQTPVSDSMRQYAQQLCDPMATFLEDTSERMETIEAQAQVTPEGTVDLATALGGFFGIFTELKAPAEALRDDLNDIDPPEDLQDYHDHVIEEIDYFIQSIDILTEDGLGGALDLPTEEAELPDPPDFEAALIQECGEKLKDVIGTFEGILGEVGLNGGDDEGDETATPPPPGAVGETLTAGDYELTVNSYENPYTSAEEFFVPPTGQQWVLLDVSITNISDEPADYGQLDFTLRDSDDFSYDTTYVGQERDLSFGTLQPDETIRGEIGFELPIDAHPERLIFEPGFFGETRIDVLLP